MHKRMIKWWNSMQGHFNFNKYIKKTLILPVTTATTYKSNQYQSYHITKDNTKNI